MGKDVIIACDFASAEETFKFLDNFTEEKPYVKIGMELYYAEGPAIVREIKKRNKSIICYIIIKKKENNCFPFFVSAHELCIYKKR